MRIGSLWLLLAALALGCAHRGEPSARPVADRRNDPMPLPGDDPLPVRDANQIVGRYHNLIGSGELMISADLAGLMMQTNREAYGVAIRDNGTLAVAGHYGARLFRRDGRTLLSVLWCYMYGLYERVDATGTSPGSG